MSSDSKPIAIAVRERVDEQIARLLAPTERPPGIDQPEPADQKSRFRQAEIVRRRIAHNVLLAQKFALHRLDGADEARIVGLDQADIGQQQDAGVEIVGAERGREGLALFGFQALLQHAPG